MARDLSQLLGPDESVVLQTRQHPFVLVRDCGVLLLVLAMLGVARWYAKRPDWLDNDAGDVVRIALWVVIAAVVLTIAWRVLGWLTERLYLTTSKVVYARGVLNRDVVSTPLVKVDEVTLRRPLLGRILGFGRLDVANASGGAEPLAGLEYLPRPIELYRLVTDRARNQRMVEGGAHRDDDGDGLVDPVAPLERESREPATKRPDDHDDWAPTGSPTSR